MMEKTITINVYASEYCKQMVDLFIETGSTVNAEDYDAGQINAWIGIPRKNFDFKKWDSRFASSYTLVALFQDMVVGFGNLVNNDYVDMLFSHKEHLHNGIASNILKEFEIYAIVKGSSYLESDVSITAVKLFERTGFQIIRKQVQIRNGIELINYKMRKYL